MKYTIVAVFAFLLGIAFGPMKAKAGVSGVINVEEVKPGKSTSVFDGSVVGFSCAPNKEDMHCYIAWTQ